MEKVYLASPHMSDEGYEKEFVKEAFDTNWIAPLGENVNEFEKEIASYIGVSDAAALSSGTAAIHLALKAAGIKAGDRVFCQDLTFAASANPIIYENAIPVFIDSEDETWNMDPLALKKAFEKYPDTRIVVVVNLYGTPAKLDEIKAICDEHNATLVEDAAESLGALYKGVQTGNFGKYSIFSFNGNKIITTSGGGMLVSNDKEKVAKVRFWSTQSRENELYYKHNEIGYNYRLSNVLAGIGRGQLKVLDKRVEQKTQIFEKYKNGLEYTGYLTMQKVPENFKPNHWLSVALINPKYNITPEVLVRKLRDENIEARMVWNPMHLQPVFKDCDFVKASAESISEKIFNTGICLPSDTKMSIEIQDMIIEKIKEIIDKSN